MEFIKKMNQWREFEKDSFNVYRQLVDVAGELVGGMILSHVTNKFSNGENLIEKENDIWFRFKREEFANEIRITPRQLDRALKELEIKKLIETRVMKDDDGVPQKHIRLCY